MEAGSPPETIRIFCLGPFTAFADNYKKLSIQTQKSKAVLALLALAARGSRSRVWLRDKLWSDRDEKQGSASLRQSLLEIRKALGPEHSSVLAADKHTVTLDLDRVRVDVLVYRKDPALLGEVVKAGSSVSQELLEGIDIVDPEFEEWLTTERSAWADTVELAKSQLAGRRSGEDFAARESRSDDAVTAHQARGTSAETYAPIFLTAETVSRPAPVFRFGLGMLPNICAGADNAAVSVADLIAEAIAKSLLDLQPIDIYDYRDMVGHNFGLSGADGPDWLMRVRIAQLGDAWSLTILVYLTSSMKLVWSNTTYTEAGGVHQLAPAVESGFIAQSADRLAQALFSQRGLRLSSQAPGAKASYAALNLIFRNDVDCLNTAEKLLEASQERDPQATYLGLLAYISCMRVGENLGAFDDRRRRATQHYAREAMDADPYNSLSLACIGHVHGYVMREFETAGEHLGRAIELNPHQAFAWDHYALLNLYTGKLDEALKASKKAVLLGSYSPLRYSFETTLAMVSTLLGDHQTAIRYAERALSRQPSFKAAKRYLIAAYGLAGEKERSQVLIDDLTASDPNFSLESVRGDSMAIIHPAGRTRLLQGFKLAGLG